MPLHMTGLVSRRELDHPDEKPLKKVEPLNYERVLKYNPNHGPDGKFSSGGGGRKGGTAGAPTEDAFGRPLKSSFRRGDQVVVTGGGHKVQAHHSSPARVVIPAGTQGRYIRPAGEDWHIVDTGHYESARVRGDQLRPYPLMNPPAGQMRALEGQFGSIHDMSGRQVGVGMAPSKSVTTWDKAKPGVFYDTAGHEVGISTRPSGPLTPTEQAELAVEQKKLKQYLAGKKHTGSVDSSGKPTKRSTFS